MINKPVVARQYAERPIWIISMFNINIFPVKHSFKLSRSTTWFKIYCYFYC